MKDFIINIKDFVLYTLLKRKRNKKWLEYQNNLIKMYFSFNELKAIEQNCDRILHEALSKANITDSISVSVSQIPKEYKALVSFGMAAKAIDGGYKNIEMIADTKEDRGYLNDLLSMERIFQENCSIKDGEKENNQPKETTTNSVKKRKGKTLIIHYE